MSTRSRYACAERIIAALRADARCDLPDEAVGWANLAQLPRQHLYVGEIESNREQEIGGIKPPPLRRDDEFSITYYFAFGDRGATSEEARSAYLAACDAFDQYLADEPRLGYDPAELDVEVVSWGEDGSVVLATAEGWQVLGRQTVTLKTRTYGGRPS